MFVTSSILRSRVARVVVAMIVTLAGLWGQATSSLRGVIGDASGAIIDSAMVSLQNAETGFRRSTLTDSTGAPGEYAGNPECVHADCLSECQHQRGSRCGEDQRSGCGDRKSF